jgi:hypothetical protein
MPGGRARRWLQLLPAQQGFSGRLLARQQLLLAEGGFGGFAAPCRLAQRLHY